MQPPAPPNVPVETTQLGRSRTDPYAWMKDENWQDVLQRPEILREDIAQHLRAENAYAEAVLASMAPARERLFEEMMGRTPGAEESVPWPDGAWEYASRFREGSEYPIFFRRHIESGREEILLDANREAGQYAYFALSETTHSPDHRYFIYAVDTQGSEIYRIVVKDMANGEIIGQEITDSTGRFVVSPDSTWIFWIWRDQHGRPRKVFRRPLTGGDDTLIFEETNPGYFLTLQETLSRKWIMLGRGDHDTNETRLIDARTPTETPRIFRAAQTGVRYHLTHWHDRFMIVTNEDAIDFKIMQSSDDPTRWGDWKPFLPMKAGHFVMSVSACNTHLAWAERVEGNVDIHFIPRDAIGDIRAQSTAIKPEEAAFDLTPLGFLEYDKSLLRYVYASPTTPPEWFDYEVSSGQKNFRKRRDVPSGHQAADYRVERLFATAADGARIPITILSREDTKRDGAAPLLLYGYGSYGIPMDAEFSISALSLADRGWFYAVAHVRGGSEKGWSWFLDGRGEKKTNSFTDFITCARHLIDENFVQQGRIVAQGASAGGLLMGAVANMAPDLFGGIAAQVPFVDMLNTMSDASLPLTPPEWPEWGNPLEDETAYDRIAGYSPYDNVAPRFYPPILATGGLTDPRVTYWEPAKWIAKLRAIAKGGPFLCKINMEAGHGGASGRYRRLKDVAMIYSFAMWALSERKPS